MCILLVHTLLKGVSYYDLSVLSMSAMGFQKKFGWVGGFGICLTLQRAVHPKKKLNVCA